MGLFDSSAELTVQRALQVARQSANSDRKALATRAWDYYQGQQMTYLDDDLREIFEDYDSLRLLLETSFNIVRFVTNMNSMVYKQPPIRTIDGSEATATRYQEWAEEIGLDLMMELANRRTFLERTIHLRLFNDVQLNRVSLDVIGQGATDVIQNRLKQNVADAIIYTIYDSDSITGVKKPYCVFTSADQHFIFDLNGAVETIPGNDGQVNPYGVLPFVKCDLDLLTDTYFSIADERLVVAQKCANVEATALNRMVKTQAFSIPFVTGWEGKADKVVLSPCRPLVIPNAGSVGYASPAPQLMTCWEIARQKRLELASEYNIDPDALRLDGSAVSGAALKAKARRLLEERERQIKFFARYERQLFELWKIIENMERGGLDMNATISVEFGEIGFDETYQELDQKYEVLKKYRLASPEDIYQQYYTQKAENIETITQAIDDNDKAWKTFESRFNMASLKAVLTGRSEPK